MSRRIWIAEGFASDGDMYGRTLQLPDGNMRGAPPIERTRVSVLKARVGDIASCPCLDVSVMQDDESEPGQRGATCAMG